MGIGVLYPAEFYPAQPFALGSGLGAPICCAVAPPARGVIGSIFTISTVAGIGGLALEAYSESCSGSDSAGLGSNVDDPVLRINVSGIPAGSTLVVDSSLHTITLTRPDPDVVGGVIEEDGMSLLILSTSTVQWLEIRDCDDIHCLCVRQVVPGLSSEATVSVDLQYRSG